MKVAIIHLSDFHVRENDHFSSEKISKFLESLNVLGTIDEYCIVFSGDLADSGKINEYKRSRYLISNILNGIKDKSKNKFVNLFLVPGNHDLCLPQNCRTSSDIHSHYENDNTETLLAQEFSYLDNFCKESHAKSIMPHPKLCINKFCNYGNYKIQFNLINTALFSTLKPDDKELHFFPPEKLHFLKKREDVNLCITVMHHSSEWFYWKHKSALEKTLVDNSEFLLTGHDHIESSTTVSIDNSLNTWCSSAGEMNFCSIDSTDSFNVIVIDTEQNSFDGYIYTWDIKTKIYRHKIVAHQKELECHTTKLSLKHSFLKSLKEDPYNTTNDFTKYFVFPKLATEYKNKKGKYDEIKTLTELNKIITEHKKILLTGSSNSGKTSLLKHLVLNYSDTKVPLFLTIEERLKFKTESFIKHMFEEQYGDDPTLFERYQQLEKSQKMILIDNWDLISKQNSAKNLLKIIENEFEYIIISTSTTQTDILESIKNELSESSTLYELHIKPFFSEKRNQLIKNICNLKNTYNDEEINNYIKLVDSLVHNNSELFSLNPAFIIKYTNYLIEDPYRDYAKGEAVFSKIFEFELQRSIIKLTRKADVEEVLVAFEIIAGYMFENNKDVLTIENVKLIIENYNREYGTYIKLKQVIDIGVRAKIFKQSSDLSIHFYNKNHLAYFIAKYLITCNQSDPSNTEGIAKAIKNICFGINADILLFVSYLLNNSSTIMSLLIHAGDLLSPWPELNLLNKNISILHNVVSTKEVKAPTESEIEQIESVKEHNEEKNYSEDIIEAKGIFEYDSSDLEKDPYRLISAIKYTEMLCKSLPAFHSKLKLEQKQKIVETIYSYPRKIVYAMLNPLDSNFDKISEDLLIYAKEKQIKKKNGEHYTKDDIKLMFNDNARAVMLSAFDHFSELCTSSKTFEILNNFTTTEASEEIQHLMIIENYGDYEILLKASEKLLKKYPNNYDITLMIRLIVRKHIMCNKNLSHSKKTQLIDKIIGNRARKEFQ